MCGTPARAFEQGMFDKVTDAVQLTRPWREPRRTQIPRLTGTVGLAYARQDCQTTRKTGRFHLIYHLLTKLGWLQLINAPS
jgi:hypothetical protein